VLWALTMEAQTAKAAILGRMVVTEKDFGRIVYDGSCSKKRMKVGVRLERERLRLGYWFDL
jgi:hypothetical protein